MKKLVLHLSLIGALLWALGCQSTSTRPPAKLSGTYNLAVASDQDGGELLFITNADRSELTGLDLAQTTPDFIRAPNPLEPLSIPVIDYPDEIARDLNWDSMSPDGGTELTGPYVYAWGQGEEQISVVSTDRDAGLVEEKRLNVGLPITAVAARGPSSTVSDSTIYFATYDSGSNGAVRGLLWSAAIPATHAALSQLTFAPTLLRTFSGVAVNRIAVLPFDNEIVVATHAANGDGDVLWMNTTSPTDDVSLRFPPSPSNPSIRLTECRDITSGLLFTTTASSGDVITRADCGFSAPVRRLWVDAQTHNTSTTGGQELHGPHLWAALDESYCSGAEACTGLEAVDLFHAPGQKPTPRIAKDFAGLPMAKILPPRGLLTNFSLSKDAPIAIASQGGTIQPKQLGLATTAANAIFFFDASRFTSLDANGATPVATPGSSTGLLIGGIEGDSIGLGDGAARNETINLTFGGAIGPPQPYASSSGQSVTVAPELIPVARVGDFVIPLHGSNCQLTYDNTPRITALPSSGSTLTVAAFPAGCTDATEIQLRADEKGTLPFVVSGTVTGLMGRMNFGDHFIFPDPDPEKRLARYFFHNSCSVLQCDATGAIVAGQTAEGQNLFAAKPLADPQVGFTLSTQQDPSMQVGQSYTLAVQSGFGQPEAVVDPVVFAIPLHVPSSIVRSPLRNRVYVSYPSANAVIEIDLTSFSSTTGTYSIPLPYQ